MRWGIAFVPLLLLALPTGLRGEVDESPPRPPWALSGRVQDDDSGEGVSRVLLRIVLVRGLVREQLAEVRSGDDGQFQLPLPRLDALTDRQLGDARLDVYAYAASYVQIDKPCWAQARTDVARRLDSRRPTRTVRMSRGPTLRGRVVDSEGRPVDQARISIASAPTLQVDGALTTRTDPAGEFQASLRLAEGDLHVDAWKDGVGASVRRIVPLEEEVTDLRLRAIVLQPGTSLGGRAVFPDGSPATEVDLMAVSLETGRPASRELAGAPRSSARTDAEGYFAFHGLRPGRVRTSVVNPRTGDCVDRMRAVEARTGAEGVVLEIDRPRLRVHVSDDLGRPVEHAELDARVARAGRVHARDSGIRSPDGIGSIWVHPEAHGTVLVHGTGLRPIECAFELTAGAWTSELFVRAETLEAKDSGRLRIEASYADGTPLEAVRGTLLTPLAGIPLPSHRRVRFTRGVAAAPIPPGRWHVAIESVIRENLVTPVTRAVTIRPGEETLLELVALRPALLRIKLWPPPQRSRLLTHRLHLEPDDPAIPTRVKRAQYVHGKILQLAPGGWTLRLESGAPHPFRKHVILTADEMLEVVVPPR